jgi:hypothetical protein
MVRRTYHARLVLSLATRRGSGAKAMIITVIIID